MPSRYRMHPFISLCKIILWTGEGGHNAPPVLETTFHIRCILCTGEEVVHAVAVLDVSLYVRCILWTREGGRNALPVLDTTLYIRCIMWTQEGGGNARPESIFERVLGELHIIAILYTYHAYCKDTFVLTI